MPLQSLQKSLPKPALFGLYGALGGLLGALLLGELIWLLLQPKAAASDPPLVQMSVSPSLKAYQKGSNSFAVRVQRNLGYAGEVKITGGSMPKGIRIEPATIGKDDTEGKATVFIGDDVDVGTVKFDVVATGAKDKAGTEPTTKTSMQLEVLKFRPAEPGVRIAASPKLILDQGTVNKLPFRIARDRVTGPARVEVEGLPRGVTVRPVTVPDGADGGELEFDADKDAPPGSTKLKIRAKDAEGKDGGFAESRLQVNKFRPPQIDVVFVLDTTGSMGFAIAGVGRGIVAFAEQLEKNRIDYRVGLLSFKDEKIGERAQPLSFNGETLTKDLKVFREQVATLRPTGGGDNPESVLDALNDASKYAFRTETTRVLIMICDDEPNVPDRTVQTLAQANKIMKDANIKQLHQVVPPRFNRIYNQIRGDIPGKDFDIAEIASGRKNFADAMPSVSREISKLVDSVPPFKADASPEPPPAGDASSIDPAAEAPAIKSVQSDTAFASDAFSQFRLLVAIAMWTCVITGGICLLLVVGQHFYLKKTLPEPIDMARGFGGGALAGLAGGLVAQLLYQYIPGGNVVKELFRIPAWSILGALAGLGLSLIVPNLQRSRGLLGGVLGGFAGAIGFILANLIAGGLVGRVLGSMLLGAAIGIMVALVEQLFRKIWLEVKYGPHEQISVNLGPEPIKIGSEKGCTVFARGAAAVALKFWLREGKVMCEDVPNRQTVEAVPDQARILGTMTLTVRSANVADAQVAPPPVMPGDKATLPLPPSLPLPKPQPQAVTKTAPVMMSPDGCPKCGKVHPGPKGQRYCVAFDFKY